MVRHTKQDRKDMHRHLGGRVVAVALGRITHQLVPVELAERHLKAVMPTDTAQMGMPKRLVAVVVRAAPALRRSITTVAQEELELKVH